ncbi:MAG: CoA transferase [Phycisphaerales bacterium]|nr:CoA transferase [Phycisphaerales bacterium]
MTSLDRTPPLAGIIVIDLGRVLAAPFTTSVLASLGARVIKVERPGDGDDSRAFGPHHNGKSLYFTSVNCDKESIALDLKNSADRLIFEELLDGADVLVENFSPPVMASLGYAWETVRARWPRLIYGALSGFGRTGPLSSQPAYDIIVQALSGVMSLTGHPGTPPVRVGISMGDLVAGLYMALGIVSAIHKRSSTGTGCLIDVAMLDCQVAFLEAAVTTFTTTHVAPQALGSRHPSIAPFQAYRCKDQWIVVAAGNDALFAALCAAIGRADLSGSANFATNANRVSRIDALEQELTATLATRDASAWIALLTCAGVPCAPIQSIEQMVAMPQVVAREMVVPVDDPALPTTCVPGNPIKMSSVTPRTSRRGAPDLDQDRAAILKELSIRRAQQGSPVRS